MLGKDGERGRSIFRDEHFIAVLPEERFGHCADRLFIVDDEDRLAMTARKFF